MGNSDRSWGPGFILFVAEGFGTGRFPVAPGTVGTLAGFGWIYLLLLPQNFWFYCTGILIGYFAAVWFGGHAETICGRKDPGSIVIDEIAALPLAFVGAVIARSSGGSTPGFADYFTRTDVWLLLIAFVGFRFFDIAKPWVIGRSQHLPGGWGLVTDDFLAAVPVAVITYVAARLF